ncbi:MAG: 2-C-methyl-D-erythritol 4-phosphate cytidylyltransferase [Brumimicrobium sp.]|nr:2-C-methyl-D-erythritol 4-phosphate cytidylyltransferase [Brumimicrobium sp.]
MEVPVVKRTVIITAGGTGKRMGTDLPKQFLLLGNKPLLMHTLQVFHDFDPKAQIILTLPKDWIDTWKKLCDKYSFEIPHITVLGGKERFHSIQKAVKIAQGEYIAVHDGVRPLVSMETIKKVFKSAKRYGSGVPVLHPKDSLREVSGERNRPVERGNFRLVQTPQCFRSDWLKKAYEDKYSEAITDDATLVGNNGFPIHLTEGNEENIKITTPFDLKIATSLIK